MAKRTVETRIKDAERMNLVFKEYEGKSAYYFRGEHSASAQTAKESYCVEDDEGDF